MQFSKSALFYFLASAGVAAGDTTNSNLKDAVGDGGVNKMSFSLTYTNNDGSICSPCLLCEGSALPNVFDPKSASLCVSCTGNDSCNEAIITNSFHKAWGMTYTSFVSHEGDASLDPDEISILASDDYDEGSDSGTWNKLATSSAALLFQQRNMPQHILCDNSVMYRHYRIVLRCKDNSNMMKIGHVGIVQSYTKTYAVQIFENITKSDVLGLVAPKSFGPAMVGFCYNLNGNFNGYQARVKVGNYDDSNDCLMSCYNYVMSSNLEGEHVSGCQSDRDWGQECWVYNKNSYIAGSGNGDTTGTCWVTGNRLVAPNPFGPAMVGFCYNLNGNHDGDQGRKKLGLYDDINDCLMSCYSYVLSSNLEDEHVSGCQYDRHSKTCWLYNKNSYIASSGSGDTRGTCWVTGNQ